MRLLIIMISLMNIVSLQAMEQSSNKLKRSPAWYGTSIIQKRKDSLGNTAYEVMDMNGNSIIISRKEGADFLEAALRSARNHNHPLSASLQPNHFMDGVIDGEPIFAKPTKLNS